MILVLGEDNKVLKTWIYLMVIASDTKGSMRSMAVNTHHHLLLLSNRHVACLPSSGVLTKMSFASDRELSPTLVEAATLILYFVYFFNPVRTTGNFF